MPKLVLLVGPPGSGKSTMARKMVIDQGFERFNQDEQGKGHLHDFDIAVFDRKDIVVDRMNFNKQQRSRYLDIAKSKGYETEIVVLHENYRTCFERVMSRQGHETIKDEKNARAALGTFFGKYERPEAGEADKITFLYPEGPKEKVIVCDLDGTLCDVEHRRHHVRKPDGVKKDWVSFFKEIPNDPINMWCKDIIEKFDATGLPTVFCSGRSTNEQRHTKDWLEKHGLGKFPLYMRDRHDSRQDSIVKEIILDFELLTRYVPYFMIDDRKQVVEMWRKRGFVCLQCDEGDF
jgi:predicted kinase